MARARQWQVAIAVAIVGMSRASSAGRPLFVRANRVLDLPRTDVKAQGERSLFAAHTHRDTRIVALSVIDFVTVPNAQYDRWRSEVREQFEAESAENGKTEKAAT